MFIGRKKELKQLSTELSSWKRKTAVLIYGKRRVGKSTLIQQAAKSFKGKVINYMCVSSTLEGNLDLIYRSVSDGLGIPNIKFDSLFAMMDYLKTLDKKILLDMDTIHKTEPINRKNDKKKQFYEISDNLIRFYFTYIFGRTGTIARIGEEQFFNNAIEPSLTQYVSRRLEGITLQYFNRMALLGRYPDIEEYGCYWYDDPQTKTNGEFDCVLKRNGENYDFYECKYYDRPMSLDECTMEKEQLKKIRGIQVSGIGFVCSGGFECDILPPPVEAGASSRQLASSRFSFDSTIVLSISELTPCAPRFCIIGYARTIRMPSFLMFIAAFTSLS